MQLSSKETIVSSQWKRASQGLTPTSYEDEGVDGETVWENQEHRGHPQGTCSMLE